VSVGAQTKASGSTDSGVADGGGRGADRGSAAGMLFGRLTVLPVVVAVAWLLVGLPLLLLNRFTPVLMLVVCLPVMAALVFFALRMLPAQLEDALPFGRPGPARTPWWAVLGVVAVAVAFGVNQMIYHSQFIIITRDPASYIQFAAWISHHGSLPIPQENGAFGGTNGLLSFNSAAFYEVGRTIVPQFMAGLPMVLAAGFWIGGINTAVAMGPILGALAVLTFGGLVARLVGARWAPLACLALAVALPMQFTSRSTYSEPLAAILFLGGLCLVIDCLRAEGIAARVLAALGGLALGLTFVVRLDGASDILPVIPYCGLLVWRRRPQAWPMIGGFAIGVAYGIVDGVVLSMPYLQVNWTSVKPLMIISIVVAAATILITAAAVIIRRALSARTTRPPWLRLPRWLGEQWLGEQWLGKQWLGKQWLGTPGKWLPTVAGALPILAVIALAVRPYVQVVRAAGTPGFESTIAADQLAAGQPIDPGRLYYEISIDWVFWYIGVPAVIFGAIGAAILVRRALRGGLPAWTLPLLVFSWAIVSTLYRPAIAPDQPWASRRLVPAVLPGFILLAVWAVSWLSGWLREHQIARVARGAAMACCGAALVLPATITTFGLHVEQGGPVGVRLTADGLAMKRTYQDEILTVDRLCAALPAKASVIFLINGGSRAGNELVEVVRGMCNRPAAIWATSDVRPVANLIKGIERAGRQPVLMAGYANILKRWGGPIRHIVSLQTQEDGGTLTSPPTGTQPFNLSVWMSQPRR
jgi:hypothetical protein